MNISTCHIEELQQKRIGMVSNKLLRVCVGLVGGGEGGVVYVLLDPNPRSLLLQRFKTFGPYEGFLNT